MKPITITEADKEQIRADFMKALETVRLADGSFTFTRSFASKEAKEEERAHLYYTPEAYLKMLMLLKSFETEIGWHGLIRQLDERSWLVYDILVYDQEVTGSTVNTDYEGYGKFLIDLTEEQANHMFFHGHSHVNMGVYPSSVDINHRTELMAASDPDKTWIFQIWNKRGECSTAIYDIPNNIMYETKDVDMAVLFDEGTSTNTTFIAAAKEKVKTRAASVVPFQQAADKKQKKSDGKKQHQQSYEDWDDLVDDGTAPYGRGYGGYYS